MVVVVRLYGLPGAALPDYDSVYNWQTVREVAAGNLTHLFHQGAPLFYLVFVPVVWLGGNFHVLQYANALLAVAAVGSLAAFVGREARLPAWQTASLALFIGTSVFLTFSGLIWPVTLAFFASICSTTSTSYAILSRRWCC